MYIYVLLTNYLVNAPIPTNSRPEIANKVFYYWNRTLGMISRFFKKLESHGPVYQVKRSNIQLRQYNLIQSITLLKRTHPGKNATLEEEKNIQVLYSKTKDCPYLVKDQVSPPSLSVLHHSCIPIPTIPRIRK